MRMRSIFICIFILFFYESFSQKKVLELTLSDVVDHYSLQSPAARVEHLNYQNIVLEYANYKKGFLPSISFTLNPMNFNRSLKLLQSPEDGNYSYVEDYSNASSVGLNISQKIGLTGGNINIGTNLSLLDEYSRDYQTFSASPFYINYSQDLWGGRKQLRLERKIRDNRNLISVKQYCLKLAEIQERSVELYLAVLSEKLLVEFSMQNISVNDTLRHISKIKLENGDITSYDYKQIELQMLDTQYTYQQALKRYKEAVRDLTNYLKVDADSISINIPQLELPLLLETSVVEHHVKRNNPSLLEEHTKLQEAELDLLNAKLETRINGNISLNFGLNQYAESLSMVYKNANQRQSLNITFRIPVYQWGVNCNKQRIANNNYKIKQFVIENSIREFSNDIKKHIDRYNHSVCLWQLAEASCRLSHEQYMIAVKAFTLGELSVYELTSARQKQNDSIKQYYVAIKDTYISYFHLRSLSLYDFQTEQDLEDVFTNIQELN